MASDIVDEDKVLRVSTREPLMRSVSDFGFRATNNRQFMHRRPKLPLSPRQRTISLNQNLVSTEREPILRDEKSNKTIFVQGMLLSTRSRYSSNCVATFREAAMVFT